MVGNPLCRGGQHCHVNFRYYRIVIADTVNSAARGAESSSVYFLPSANTLSLLNYLETAAGVLSVPRAGFTRVFDGRRGKEGETKRERERDGWSSHHPLPAPSPRGIHGYHKSRIYRTVRRAAARATRRYYNVNYTAYITIRLRLRDTMRSRNRWRRLESDVSARDRSTDRIPAYFGINDRPTLIAPAGQWCGEQRNGRTITVVWRDNDGSLAFGASTAC